MRPPGGADTVARMDNAEGTPDEAGKSAQGSARPSLAPDRASSRAKQDPQLRATLFLDQWDRNQAEIARTGPLLPRRFRV